MREVGSVSTRTQTDVYVIHHGGEAHKAAMLLSERLRDLGVRVITHPGEGSLKSQMKKADASGARFAIFATEDELARGAVAVKALREGEASWVEQTLVALADAPAAVAAALSA